MLEKKIRIQQENLYEITQTDAQNTLILQQLLENFYLIPKKNVKKRTLVCKMKTYFPPEPKTDTTAQLKKKFLQPTRSECMCLSVCDSVRKGQERDVE